MLDRDAQLRRIIAAWTERIVNEDTTVTEMAEIALTALECGETHPDRASVRCTQLPHGNGHLYHRNTELGLEWWTNDDAVTSTVHDVLGPITLVQRPPLTDVEILVQFPSGEGPAETQVDEPRGRYHTLPPCEDDDASCGAKHPKWDWYCDREPHEVTTEDHSTWHHDNTRDRYWPQGREPEDDPGVDTTPIEADLDIYRDLIPLLGPVATYLDQISKRYRDGNPRTTASQCRSAEGYRDQLTGVIDLLREMIGAGVALGSRVVARTRTPETDV